ncbi:MAG: hypothetical protein Q9159_003123 [Coniocarpon cinnabarinum]
MATSSSASPSPFLSHQIMDTSSLHQSFAPINNHHFSNPTPPDSIMDEGSPPPSDFINPQDISNDAYTMGMSSRESSVSLPGGHPAPFDDGSEPPKKKRKSWGQVLPKPTTNLPPRKRAKTDEEKAQRKYERVQRNRHAAHMSRMRKQDEMENLRIENDRLRIDNSDLENEIRRLRDELGGRPGGAPTTSTFSPRIKSEMHSRPVTPADPIQRTFSTDSSSSMPSLSYSSTSSTPSNDFEDSEHRPSFADKLPSFDPSTINPSDLKQSDVSLDIGFADAHSGFTNTQTESQDATENRQALDLTTSDLVSNAGKLNPSPMDDNIRFTMNDLIDFDGLDVDSDKEDLTGIRGCKTSPTSAVFNFSSSSSLDDYRAADANDSTLLDEAMNNAILNLPRMMSNEA